MQMLRFFIVCAAAAIMAACAKNDEARSLRYLQHLADEERYAEVLDSISKIDRRKIRSERLAARYGLLYAQALGKNDIYIGNDSLIDPAVEYYRRKGNDEQRCLSWFYKGSGLDATGNQAAAAVCYLQAEIYAKRLENDYYLGLVYSYLGSAYNAQYLRERAIEYLQLAADHYRKAGKEQNLNWTYGELGDAYFGFADYDRSTQYYYRAIDMATDRQDSVMWNRYMRRLLMVYLNLGKIDSARVIHDRLPPVAAANEMPYSEYSYLYEESRSAKQYVRAGAYLDTMYGILHSWGDNAIVSIDFKRAHLYKAAGDYESAFKYLSKYERSNDSSMRVLLKKSVTDAEAGFHREQADYNAYRLKVAHAIDYAVIALIVILCAAAAMIFRHLYLKRKRERERFMAIVDELSSSRDMLDDRLAATNQNKQRLSEMMQTQFRQIDDLMKSYYEQQNSNKRQSVIYNRVRRMIEKFADDRHTMEMFDEVIDSTRDNLMSDLKCEYPNMRAADLCLLRYIFMGLSPQSISILIGETVDNIYTRKSRLKTRFQHSGSPSRMRFVDAL